MDPNTSHYAGTSQVSSRREEQKDSQVAEKKEKLHVEAGGPSWMQQPNLDAVECSNGKTRIVNGRMEYQGDDGWIPAIYHHDIRADLLEEGPQGFYDFSRKQGKDDNDITSFHPDYKTNGPGREHRHPILFRYEQKGYPVPSYEPGIWMYRGHVVLDQADDPVLQWREIPWVLSSAYEGFDMEVVRRLNQRITYRDFRGRMPKSIIKGSIRKDSWGLSTLSMRNTRFRLSACCLAWDERQGSDKLKEYLDGLLPAECHKANSTRSFRDLTPYEVTQAKADNKGNFLSRAGSRALAPTTRQERDAVEQQRSIKLLAQHNRILGAAPVPVPQKREREEISSDSNDEEEQISPSTCPESAANLDPRLFAIESSETASSSEDSSASVPALAPALKSSTNGTSGRGWVIRPLPLQERPAPTQNPINQESEFGNGVDCPIIVQEEQAEPKPTPLYAERPVNPLPYFLTLEQWKRRQESDD